MGFDRTLRSEPAGLSIEEADPVAVYVEDRIAPLELRVVQDLVREIVHPRTRERAGHEVALWRPHVQAAGLREKRLSALALELPPEVPRALEEGHVAGVLVIGEADDPRQPAERCERVPASEAIESEDAVPTLREVICRRAAVRAEPRDDRVVHRLAHRAVNRRRPSRRCSRPPRSSGSRPRLL
jgi:hypothetical protein